MTTTSTTLNELKAEMRARSDKLHDIFEEAGPDRNFAKVKAIYGDTASKVEQVRSMNAELTDINKRIKEREELEDIAGQVQTNTRRTMSR